MRALPCAEERSQGDLMYPYPINALHTRVPLEQRYVPRWNLDVLDPGQTKYRWAYPQREYLGRDIEQTTKVQLGDCRQNLQTYIGLNRYCAFRVQCH